MLDNFHPGPCRLPCDARPDGPHAAGMWLLAQLLPFQVTTSGRDVQVVQVGTTEAATRCVAGGVPSRPCRAAHPACSAARRLRPTGPPTGTPRCRCTYHRESPQPFPQWPKCSAHLSTRSRDRKGRSGSRVAVSMKYIVRSSGLQPRPLETPIPSRTNVTFGPGSSRYRDPSTLDWS